MAPTNCGECELPLRWEQIEDRRGLGEPGLLVAALCPLLGHVALLGLASHRR